MGKNKINGTPGDDVIYGTGEDDRIVTMSGNDYIEAGDGDDFVASGSGSDTVILDGGSDKGRTAAGDDCIHPGAGYDNVVSAAGYDTFVHVLSENEYNVVDHATGYDHDYFQGANQVDNLVLVLTADQMASLEANYGVDAFEAYYESTVNVKKSYKDYLESGDILDLHASSGHSEFFFDDLADVFGVNSFNLRVKGIENLVIVQEIETPILNETDEDIVGGEGGFIGEDLVEDPALSIVNAEVVEVSGLPVGVTAMIMPEGVDETAPFVFEIVFKEDGMEIGNALLTVDAGGTFDLVGDLDFLTSQDLLTIKFNFDVAHEDTGDCPVFFDRQKIIEIQGITDIDDDDEHLVEEGDETGCIEEDLGINAAIVLVPSLLANATSDVGDGPDYIDVKIIDDVYFDLGGDKLDMLDSDALLAAGLGEVYSMTIELTDADSIAIKGYDDGDMLLGTITLDIDFDTGLVTYHNPDNLLNGLGDGEALPEIKIEYRVVLEDDAMVMTTDPSTASLELCGVNDCPTISMMFYAEESPISEDFAGVIHGNLFDEGMAADADGDDIFVVSVKGIVDGDDGFDDGVITVMDDWGTLLVYEETGDYSFDLDEEYASEHLFDGETQLLEYAFVITDYNLDPDSGEVCNVDSKLKIEINGEDDMNFDFHIPSNLVLYLDDGDEDCSDIIKVKFDYGDMIANDGNDFDYDLDHNADGKISDDEIALWIDDHSDALDGNTELIAFSIHDGNLGGVVPLPAEGLGAYDPDGTGGQDGDNKLILGPGEGQLVFFDGEGFEVTGDAFDIGDDVEFNLDGEEVVSAELAGTCLDPTTDVGAAILGGTLLTMDAIETFSANDIPVNA